MKSDTHSTALGTSSGIVPNDCNHHGICMSFTSSDVKDDFVRFLFEEAGSSGRGTVSTYLRAIDVLSDALRISHEVVPFNPDVWSIASPKDLLVLQQYVIEQQKLYVERGAGIFANLKSVGRSYFKNRWCSAAVRQLAKYRGTHIYEESLQKAFEDVSNGEELSIRVGKVKIRDAECFIPENVQLLSKEGKDAIIVAKRRINQSVFRKWIMGIYGNACCVTGLNVPEVLRASHIVSWANDKSNRMNPSNGLCLSATYDAAFDRHLISFDDDYRMVLSKRIRDFFDRDVCAAYFRDFEGMKIHLPSRFLPDRRLLERHRDLLVS